MKRLRPNLYNLNLFEIANGISYRAHLSIIL